MTDSPFGTNTTGANVPSAPSPPSKWKRPLIATLLSLVTPGLGQLYNRQFWKGICVGLTGPALYIPAGYFGAFRSFRSFVTLSLLLILWQVGVAVETFVTARRQSFSHMLNPLPTWRWILGVVLLVAPVSFVPGGSAMERIMRVRPYKVPSASNCPTVCEGERMIVDPSAYRINPPRRGDLVMFRHPKFDSLLFKRVVGLPGDVVTQADDGILVNGKPAVRADLAHVCGNPPALDRSYLPVQPRTLTVPTDSLYVVGDNWSNSFDSRIEEFGFVHIQNVRGRPLFLYWSPYKNRIGCHLR